MTYALYNIGSKIKPFNPTLYSNSQPHSPKPNFYWSRILKEISKVNISPDAFESLNFKSLYLLILNPDSNSIPSLPDPLNTKATPSSHTSSFPPQTTLVVLFKHQERNRFQDSLQRLCLGVFISKTFNPSPLS